MFRDFLASVGFLTTLPVPAQQTDRTGFSRMAFWFPCVGAVVGLLLLGADSGLRRIFPAEISAALVLLVWVCLTGGLHLDGLGDCCDAFFAPVPPERRLEILKDVHMGAFGVSGIVLQLLVKYAVLLSLPPLSPWVAGTAQFSLRWGLLVAPVLARWGVLVVTIQPRARQDGLGAAFARDLKLRTVLLAGILPALLVLWLGLPAVAGALAVGGLIFAIIRWAKRAIGGVTGDVLGMTIEVSETLFLIVLALKIWR